LVEAIDVPAFKLLEDAVVAAPELKVNPAGNL